MSYPANRTTPYPDFLAMPSPIPEAFRLAAAAHDGQFDRAGKPYIYHPMTVSAGVGDDPNTIAAALLHDVIEDTEVALSDLENTFPAEVVELVRLMTHAPETPYLDYIQALKDSGNPKAIRIKISDLCTNTDVARLPEISERDILRVRIKYIPALKMLLNLE